MGVEKSALQAGSRPRGEAVASSALGETAVKRGTRGSAAGLWQAERPHVAPLPHRSPTSTWQKSERREKRPQSAAARQVTRLGVPPPGAVRSGVNSAFRVRQTGIN